MDKQSERELHEDSAGEVCCAGYSFNKIIRIFEQGNKALINLVDRSVRDYIALSNFHIHRTEKAVGNIFLH